MVRAYEIRDQALSLKVLFDTKTVEGLTSVRFKLGSSCLENNILEARLCAKQLSINSVTVDQFQMYHHETKEILNLKPSTHYYLHWSYLAPEKQLKTYQKTFKTTAPSSYWLKKMAAFATRKESEGFLRVCLELTNSGVKKISEAFKKGFFAYFSTKVQFKVQEPISGGFFLDYLDGKQYFLKDNKLAHARCIFPCLDSLDDYCFISTVRISTDRAGTKIFCLGDELSYGKSKDNLFVTDFKVNRVISPNFLSIIVGNFEQVGVEFNTKTSTKRDLRFGSELVPPTAGRREKIILYCQNKEIAYRVKRNYKNFSSFFSRLKDFETDRLKLDKFHSLHYNWVILENFFSYDLNRIAESEFIYKYNSFFFYNTIVLDSSILADNRVKEISLFMETEIIRRFACVIHIDYLAIKSIKDYWMFIGLTSFVADVYVLLNSSENQFSSILEKKRRKYYEMVENGFDINPIMKPNFSHPSEIFCDECYTLKCNLILMLVFSYLKLSKSNAGAFASIFLGDKYDTEAIKSNMQKPIEFTDTHRFFKSIKRAVGFTNLKSILHQYLFNTGITEVDCAYIYYRKENKVKLLITQTPTHLKHYKQVMDERFKIEKFFNLISPIKKILENFETQLIGLSKLSDGNVSLNSIKQFLQEDERVIVNKEHCALKYLSGTFNVNITETNEIESQIQTEDIELDSKRSQEISFYLKGKFRRVVQKKGYDHNTFGYAGYNDEGKIIERSEPDMVGGGAPYLWIKLDPYNKYLKRIIIRDGEDVLLAQLEKDIKDQVDLPSIFRILDSLQTCATQASINKLCSLLMTRKITNQHLKIEIVNALTKMNIKNAQKKILHILIGYIKKIKFESDNSLKPNNFDDPTQPYYLLNHLISSVSKYERKCTKSSLDDKPDKMNDRDNRNRFTKVNPQTDESIVSILLSLIKKNDNSQNKYDDSYYQSNILRSLFRCLNLANFNQVMVEVNRFLKIEFFTHYDYKFLIKTIFEYFLPYVTAHFDHLGISLASSHTKFYDNPAIKKFPRLVEAIEPFRKLAKRHKCDILLADSIFKMKLHLKKKIEQYKPWEIFIWALKYIEKVRTRANIYVVHKILSEFLEYIKDNKKEFQSMQIPLSIQNQKLFNEVLFDSVNAPHTFMDTKSRYLLVCIYKQIYDEFIPICHLVDHKNKMFPLDMNWLNFKYVLNYEKSLSNEDKMITLNYLNLEKKKKAITGPMGPTQGSSKYNIRDLILQNFKWNKKPFTWKNLCSQIVNVLLGEKFTASLEVEVADLEEANTVAEFHDEAKSKEVFLIYSFIKFY